MAETCPDVSRINWLITKINCKRRLNNNDRRDIANALHHAASRIDDSEFAQGVSVAAPTPQRPHVSLDQIMDLMRRLERGDV